MVHLFTFFSSDVQGWGSRLFGMERKHLGTLLVWQNQRTNKRVRMIFRLSRDFTNVQYVK